jgi:hypothetical protein
MRILKFEYCTHIGDFCIRELLKSFKGTLEKFEVSRNFYENIAHITDDAFDINKEGKPNLVKD